MNIIKTSVDTKPYYTPKLKYKNDKIEEIQLKLIILVHQQSLLQVKDHFKKKIR